jgi:acetoin utilization deacetylase AcuC-like enzyme
MTLAFISHPSCLEHDMGSWHPERPARLHAIQDRLTASGLGSLLRHHEAPLVQPDQLLRVHGPAYLHRLETAAPNQEGDMYWIDGDTGIMPHTLPAAQRAAGAAVLAVDLVLQGEVQAAFCSIRPPGHHAERNRAMGFCFYNNLAVAAAHALEQHRLERIAIVDFDVHHGNGTEDIFSGDRRVLFCSSFQHPFYPYRGADSKAENVCNLPLPAGTDGKVYRAAVERAWLPRLDAFRPQLVLFSAGFDGHAEDAMSQFQLREPDYAWITRQVKEIADRHADGRLLSCLEGGYDLSSLGRSVAVHIDELLGHR